MDEELARPVSPPVRLSTGKGILDEDSTLLNALIESDQLGPVFKETFGSDKAQEAKMVAKLDAIMKEKQEELQEICSSHYEEFVGCMDNLLELRSDVTVLHNDLVTFEEELHSTGDELLQRSRRHVALLRISENMRLARSRIEECVAILHKTAQIQTSLDKKMHILALRQVEELQESSRLEEMSLGADGFEWAKFYAREVIPAIQMLVRQNAIDKFNEWLFTVRDCSPKVGRFALAQTALSQHLSSQRASQMSGIRENPSKCYQFFVRGVDAQHLEEGIFDHVPVDFTPVHQCLHIHDVLALRGFFQQYYNENRLLQCNMALQLNSDFVDGKSAESFAGFFSHIAGFFIIEDTVYRTTTNFLRRRVVDELWKTATSKVTNLVREILTNQTSGYLVYLMETAWIFTSTLNQYSYDISPWVDMLSVVCDRCIDRALEQANQKTHDILGNEKFEPLRISRTNQLFRELITENGLEEEGHYRDANEQDKSKELEFPFSMAVPLICNLIRSFASEAYGSSRYAKKPEEQLSQAMDQLLVHIGGAFQLTVDESFQHSNIAQLVQVYQNLSKLITYLRNDLEFALTGLKFSNTIAHRCSKAAVAMLKHVQTQCQNKLAEICQTKVSMFLSLTDDIQWTPDKPQSEGASPHVQDFIIYLEAIYQMLRPLSNSLRDGLLIRLHTFIGKCLLDPMTMVPEFNCYAVTNVQSDITYLVKFAKAEGFEKSMIEGLTEAKQTMDLLLEPKMDSLLTVPKFREKYDSVTGDRLHAVLGRYRPNTGLQKKIINDSVVKKLFDGLASL